MNNEKNIDYSEYAPEFGPLQPYAIPTAGALPIFNITEPTKNPFFRASVAGFAALMRYIQEYRAKKLGFEEANAIGSKGTYQIEVHTSYDPVYSTMDTAIYTWMDGKRHGLVLREIVRK